MKVKLTSGMAVGALGLSPTMSVEKTRIAATRKALGLESDFKHNVATEWGKHNEKGALLDYYMETGSRAHPLGFCVYDDWLVAGPVHVVDQERIVQVYCPYSLRDQDDPEFQSCFQKYHLFAKIQFSLLASKSKVCDFYQWSPNATKIEEVQINWPWLDEKMPRLEEFREIVLREVQCNAGAYS